MAWFALNARKNISQKAFQFDRIVGRKGIRFITVDIKDRDQIARAIMYWQNQFGPSGTGARDMSGKSINIRHQLRRLRARGGAAHSARKRDYEAAMPTLIWPDL